MLLCSQHFKAYVSTLFAVNVCCRWFTTTLPKVTLHSKCCLPANDSFACGYKGATPLLRLGKPWRAISQQQSSSEDMPRLHCRPPSSPVPSAFLLPLRHTSFEFLSINLHGILCLICFQKSISKRWKRMTIAKGVCDVVMASACNMSSED